MSGSEASETASVHGSAGQRGVTSRGKSSKGRKEDALLWKSDLDVWYKEKDVEINLDEDRFIFDLQGKYGQSRAFLMATFRERLQSFSQELPTGLCKITVWPQDVKGLFFF